MGVLVFFVYYVESNAMPIEFMDILVAFEHLMKFSMRIQ